jgi:tryptophan-rich sensory protein
MGGLTSGAVSVWLFFWAYRRKYELDYKLDSTAQTMRWLIVVFGFTVALIPGPQFKIVRIIAGVLLLAFLAWPNFAHYLTQLLRRVGL